MGYPRKCNGVVGVPITAIDKLYLEIFEIVGVLNHPVIGGKALYKRLLIRRKNQGEPAAGQTHRDTGQGSERSSEELGKSGGE